jgi:hypothetical protein
MVLKERNARAPAKTKEAEAISKRSLPEQAATDDIARSEEDGLAGSPSFEPLPWFAPRHDRSAVETGKGAPQALAASDTPHAPFARSRSASDRAAVMRQPNRHSPTLLLVACALVIGIGGGVGGTYLINADPSVQTIRPLPGIGAASENAAHIGVGAALRSNLPSGSMPSSIDRLSRDPDGQNQAEGETDSRELSTLRKQVDRQFAEGRLDQPEGDNALDTYRQIVALAPHAAATVQLGDRLSGKFWSLATRARAAEQWDDALHYFEILKTLPAVPLAAISTKDDFGQGIPAAARLGAPPSPPRVRPSGGQMRPKPDR